MIIKAPEFWYNAKSGRDRFIVAALSPLSRIYDAVVRHRFDMHYPIPLLRPVICVGNLVAGGAGKTPVVQALLPLLFDLGYNPHILSRGYGGEEEGPLQVAPGRDTYEDVGDEALLHAQAAPAWVSRNRAAGAQAAIDTGATAVLMDDGFQNPSLYKNFSLLVFDGASGIGNGKVMPAGPLRESMAFGLSRADAVLILGEDKCGVRKDIEKRSAVPIFTAHLRPAKDNPDVFGKQVFAFAGIGRPEKFRDTLVQAGAVVEGWASFPDHYPYSEEDLGDIIAAAKVKNAPVITTAKDYTRLPSVYKKDVLVFGVEAVFDDAGGLSALIAQKLAQGF